MDKPFARPPNPAPVALLDRRFLCACVLALAGCAAAPPAPLQTACQQRMDRHAAELLPGFHALGYRPAVQLRLDDEMRDGRGFRQSGEVLGDASPGGRVRLRAARLCRQDAVARAVIAHEIAHVALQHRGTPGTGVVLEWEVPPQEVEADRLALEVLRRTGGYPAAERFIECHRGNCGGMAGPAMRRPGMRLLPGSAARPAP